MIHSFPPDIIIQHESDKELGASLHDVSVQNWINLQACAGVNGLAGGTPPTFWE